MRVTRRVTLILCAYAFEIAGDRMAARAVGVEISFACLSIAYEQIQMEADGISSGRAALGAHNGKDTVQVFRNRDAICLDEVHRRVVFGEAGVNEFAVLVVHCDGRAEEVVAFTCDAAHVCGMATRAMGVIEFLAAKQHVLRCEGTDELIEFVGAASGNCAAARSAGATSSASACAAGRGGWRFLCEQQQASGDKGKTGSGHQWKFGPVNHFETSV